MSKFIDKLKSRTQLLPAPIGFGKAVIQEEPRILLIAAVSQTDNVVDLVKGTDVGLLIADRPSSLTKNLPKLAKAVPDVLWGGWLNNPRWDEIENMKNEADFIIFSPEMPLIDLPADLGRILAIDASFTDTQLRAIDELPVEAVLFTVKPDKLNWQYLITLQRLDNIIAKPLLAIVPADITGKGLQSIWSVGVDGVVIEVNGGSANRLKELNREIEKMVFPLPRKSKKMDVMLPFISQQSPAETEEEDE